MSSDIGPMSRGRLGATKTIFEILAIIVGGWWVLFTFWVKDCPNLERRIGVNTDIQWHKVEDRCEADVAVAIENNGGAPVDVKHIDVRAWGFPSPVATSTAYFDQTAVSKIGESLPVPPSVSDALSLLTTHYPVNTNAHQTLEWSFPADASRSVYFEAVVTANGIPGHPKASTWDRVCGDARGGTNPRSTPEKTDDTPPVPAPTSTAPQ
jgi:hypothetical protein